MKLYELTAHEVRDLLRNKTISCQELTQACLDRIEEVEPRVNGYITITHETALKQAKAVDEKINKGEPLPDLAGIPMALKDNICTKDILTTCASKMLENFRPPYNATVSEKLLENYGVLLGKTNMDEFAMGSSTENSFIKPTLNPWDTTRVPGGSSGGSAAVVSADEAIYSLGSDTGGSIRQPASLCGVVGLKPTYGLVSRYGLVAFASSLDQIGPITKDVTDCALVLNAIAGHDDRDYTSVKNRELDYTKYLVDDIEGFKVGIPKEYFSLGINPQVKESVIKAVDKLQDMGAKVEEFSLKYTDYALSVYYVISSAEASSNLARYDGVKYGYRAKEYDDMIDMYKRSRSQGFGVEAKRRIMLGTYVLSAGHFDEYYLKALKARTLIKEDFDRAFEKYDLIVAPTCPTTAFKVGNKAEDPLEMYLTNVYTAPVNIAGLPALSMNCGFDDNGLPIGIQLISKAFHEKNILRAAYALEKDMGINDKKPKL
ncbi:MAG: Asp-tRNA(Asn)/Glu-tRNA(Gln) amidotransferase subunit GatA [Mahellales bacterium]